MHHHAQQLAVERAVLAAHADVVRLKLLVESQGKKLNRATACCSDDRPFSNEHHMTPSPK